MKRASNWFRKRRHELGRTGREVARDLDVAEASVRNWEAEHASPNPTLAPRLARAYEAAFETVAIEIVRLAVRVKHHRRERGKAA